MSFQAVASYCAAADRCCRASSKRCTAAWCSHASPAQRPRHRLKLGRFSFFSLRSLAPSSFGPSRSRRLAYNTAVVNRPSPPSTTCCAARSQRRRVCCAARTLPLRVEHVRSPPQRRRAPRSTGHRAVPPRNAPAQRLRSHSRLDQAQAAAADVARLASRRSLGTRLCRCTAGTSSPPPRSRRRSKRTTHWRRTARRHSADCESPSRHRDQHQLIQLSMPHAPTQSVNREL